MWDINLSEYERTGVCSYSRAIHGIKDGELPTVDGTRREARKNLAREMRSWPCPNSYIALATGFYFAEDPDPVTRIAK